MKKDDECFDNNDEEVGSISMFFVAILLMVPMIFLMKYSENKTSKEEAQLYDLQSVVMNISLYDTPIPITKSLTANQKTKLNEIHRNIDNCMERKEQLGVSGLSECYEKNESLFKALKVGFSDRLIFK
ncbi:hypothetical protein ACSSUQ_004249 [Yersinia enterocolitica]